ncbi:MAG TPA: hypothetical protein PLR07_04035, partial [Promineifilum sp.]|nr:hypothetical protein [Promineifilum sp.]
PVVASVAPDRDGVVHNVNADTAAAALAVAPDDEVILLLDDGYARRMKAAWVSEAPRANAKARALVVRKAAAVALANAGPLTLITNRRMPTADGGALPLEDSTKAFRLAKLEEEELVTAVVRG